MSTDLEAEPEVMVARDTSKRVQFNEQVVVATLEETASSEAEVEIDEAKIDRMLHALHEADPTGERNDPEELKMLEGMISILEFQYKLKSLCCCENVHLNIWFS